MRIGVVGGGVVGRATARAFIEHVEEVRVYDVVKERATHDLYPTMDADLVFLCLPSPQRENSLECNTDVIEDFLNGVGGSAQYRGANLVLRSTVPVGFTRRMRHKYNLPNLVHSPEFLTARCAVTDAQLPARNIIGFPAFDQPYYVGEGSLKALYERRFPGVPCVTCTSDESEFVKLMQNSFFATKIAFFNEMHAFATAQGMDWGVVLGAFLLDGRVSYSHTKVPGNDGFGYSGTCLPKDIANLVSCLDAAGQTPYVIEAARRRNVEVDRKR